MTYSPEGLNVKRPEGRGKSMPCPTKIAVKTYLTPDEYTELTRLAGQARMSTSTFIKMTCLGAEIRSLADQEAVLALTKINADLSRLGGLLKLALGEKALDRNKGNLLLESISETKSLLHEKINAL